MTEPPAHGFRRLAAAGAVLAALGAMAAVRFVRRDARPADATPSIATPPTPPSPPPVENAVPPMPPVLPGRISSAPRFPVAAAPRPTGAPAPRASTAAAPGGIPRFSRSSSAALSPPPPVVWPATTLRGVPPSGAPGPMIRADSPVFQKTAAPLGAGARGAWTLYGRVFDLETLKPIRYAALSFTADPRLPSSPCNSDNLGRYRIVLRTLPHGASQGGYSVSNLTPGYTRFVLDEPDIPYATLSTADRDELIKSARTGDLHSTAVMPEGSGRTPQQRDLYLVASSTGATEEP